MRKSMSALVLTLAVAAAATWQVAWVDPAPASDAAGYMIHIDPATGKIIEPAPDAIPVLLNAKTRYAFSSSFEGLKQEPSPVPGGGVMVDLRGRFQHGFVAVSDGNGGVNVPCLSGIPHDEVAEPALTIDHGSRRAGEPAGISRLVAASGANIVIINKDSPGEGFRDPTPWPPQGVDPAGNPATTLGEARLNCFEKAADIWGALINSDVTIRIDARMDELDCAPLFGVLGSAGAIALSANFDGAPRQNTYYPGALANALAGQDLVPAHSDISATFNSLLDGDLSCLLGAEWYYGFDMNPGTNQIDFVSVLVHEFGHGLGFATYVNLILGTKPDGFDDAYMLFLNEVGALPGGWPGMSNAERASSAMSDPNLRWTGPNVTLSWPLIPLINGTIENTVRVYAPSPLQLGSSVSHWSTAVKPDEAMEPMYTIPIHDPSLALWLMKDIGWPVDSIPEVPSPAGEIASIADVPNDQGGLVDLTIDANEQFALQNEVTGYNIYRLVNGGTLVSPQVVAGDQPIMTPSGRRAMPLPGMKVVSQGGDYYVIGAAAPDFPPGTWKVVGTVFATQSDEYVVEVTTAADRTSTDPNTQMYVVTTHTTAPSVWFVSDVDSGFSRDNIAPGAPAQVTVVYNADNNYMSWDPNPEPDLQYYNIYRSTSASFTPDPSNLAHATIDPSWVDDVANPSAQFYKMTAVDHAGNESDVSTPGTVTPVRRTTQSTFALHQNVPNPFNPRTTIHYDVARGGSQVTLQIFDAGGRLVKTLFDGTQSEGQKSVTWEGRNGAGQQVATGVYFYRLSAPGFSQTRRMVLLK